MIATIKIELFFHKPKQQPNHRGGYMTQQTNALLNLNHEEAENPDIGTEASNLNLVAVPRRKIQKPRSKFLLEFGGAQKPGALLFVDILEKAKGFSHPYLLYDYDDNKLLICECKDKKACPVPYTQPTTKDESSGIFCFVAPVINGKNQAGIRIDSLKNTFSADFGTLEGIKLWLGNPPNVVAQLSLPL